MQRHAPELEGNSQLAKLLQCLHPTLKLACVSTKVSPQHLSSKRSPHVTGAYVLKAFFVPRVLPGKEKHVLPKEGHQNEGHVSSASSEAGVCWWLAFWDFALPMC